MREISIYFNSTIVKKYIINNDNINKLNDIVLEAENFFVSICIENGFVENDNFSIGELVSTGYYSNGQNTIKLIWS